MKQLPPPDMVSAELARPLACLFESEALRSFLFQLMFFVVYSQAFYEYVTHTSKSTAGSTGHAFYLVPQQRQ
jgi:hypothetical protein